MMIIEINYTLLFHIEQEWNNRGRIGGPAWYTWFEKAFQMTFIFEAVCNLT